MYIIIVIVIITINFMLVELSQQTYLNKNYQYSSLLLYDTRIVLNSG